MSTIVQPSFVNPYDSLASVYSDGLDSVVQAFSGTLTLDQLIANVPAYLQTTFYPSGTPPLDQTIQLSSIVGNVFNTYTAPCEQPAWTNQQMQLVNQVLSGLKNLSINQNSVANFMQVTQENVTTSCLSSRDQVPLLMALSIVNEAYTYFFAEIASPDMYWSPFFDSNAAVNFSNLNNWVIAAFKGALIGSKQSIPVVPANAPQGTGIGLNIITVIGGALTTTFGEIVYNWAQRPTKGC